MEKAKKVTRWFDFIKKHKDEIIAAIYRDKVIKYLEGDIINEYGETVGSIVIQELVVEDNLKDKIDTGP